MKEQMHIIKGGKAISVSLDTLAKAAYITYSDKPVAKTVKKTTIFTQIMIKRIIL